MATSKTGTVQKDATDIQLPSLAQSSQSDVVRGVQHTATDSFDDDDVVCCPSIVPTKRPHTSPISAVASTASGQSPTIADAIQQTANAAAQPKEQAESVDGKVEENSATFPTGIISTGLTNKSELLSDNAGALERVHLPELTTSNAISQAEGTIAHDASRPTSADAKNLSVQSPQEHDDDEDVCQHILTSPNLDQRGDVGANENRTTGDKMESTVDTPDRPVEQQKNVSTAISSTTPRQNEERYIQVVDRDEQSESTNSLHKEVCVISQEDDVLNAIRSATAQPSISDSVSIIMSSTDVDSPEVMSPKNGQEHTESWLNSQLSHEDTNDQDNSIPCGATEDRSCFPSTKQNTSDIRETEVLEKSPTKTISNHKEGQPSDVQESATSAKKEVTDGAVSEQSQTDNASQDSNSSVLKIVEEITKNDTPDPPFPAKVSTPDKHVSSERQENYISMFSQSCDDRHDDNNSVESSDNEAPKQAFKTSSSHRASPEDTSLISSQMKKNSLETESDDVKNVPVPEASENRKDDGVDFGMQMRNSSGKSELHSLDNKDLIDTQKPCVLEPTTSGEDLEKPPASCNTAEESVLEAGERGCLEKAQNASVSDRAQDGSTENPCSQQDSANDECDPSEDDDTYSDDEDVSNNDPQPDNVREEDVSFSADDLDKVISMTSQTVLGPLQACEDEKSDRVLTEDNLEAEKTQPRRRSRSSKHRKTFPKIRFTRTQTLRQAKRKLREVEAVKETTDDVEGFFGDIRRCRSLSRPRTISQSKSEQAKTSSDRHGVSRSRTRSPDKRTTPTGSHSDGKRVAAHRTQVGLAPAPNLKNIKSRVGSLSNASYKPGGGQVKIESRPMPGTREVAPRIQARSDHRPTGGTRKIEHKRLEWKAESKVGSLTNAAHRPGGGHRAQMTSQKLNFNERATSKVGSKENANYKPGGGNIKVESRRLQWDTVGSRVGSLDNVTHRPQGGNRAIFNDTEYLRQTARRTHKSNAANESRDGNGERYRSLNGHPTDNHISGTSTGASSLKSETSRATSEESSAQRENASSGPSKNDQDIPADQPVGRRTSSTITTNLPSKQDTVKQKDPQGVSQQGRESERKEDDHNATEPAQASNNRSGDDQQEIKNDPATDSQQNNADKTNNNKNSNNNNGYSGITDNENVREDTTSLSAAQAAIEDSLNSSVAGITQSATELSDKIGTATTDVTAVATTAAEKARDQVAQQLTQAETSVGAAVGAAVGQLMPGPGEAQLP